MRQGRDGLNAKMRCSKSCQSCEEEASGERSETFVVRRKVLPVLEALGSPVDNAEVV